MQNLVGKLGEKLKGYGSQLKPYERHLSALAMIGGFGFDSLSYGRLDHPITQIILLVYIAMAAASILLLHYLEARPEMDGKFTAKLRGLLPAATQFAFGTLWSAFLVFYSRSGVLAASWPFFLVLVVIFIGNEVFKSYHSRLIFTTTLFAFALLSYAIFMVPVFTHTIGRVTFVFSGLAAAAVFLLFLRALDALGKERWKTVRWPSLGGAGGVFAAVYGLYFLGVLPPLPLAMQQAGVYTSVKHIGPVYYAMNEAQSWNTWVGAPVVVHAGPGDPVYAFGAVFAPVNLETRIRHVWLHYDDAAGEWHKVQTVSSSISGGRENGYRYYSRKTSPTPGRWRVDIETIDGRLIGRLRFKVLSGPTQGAMTTTVIK
jgi:hypothetical protein